MTKDIEPPSHSDEYENYGELPLPDHRIRANTFKQKLSELLAIEENCHIQFVFLREDQTQRIPGIPRIVIDDSWDAVDDFHPNSFSGEYTSDIDLDEHVTEGGRTWREFYEDISNTEDERTANQTKIKLFYYDFNRDDFKRLKTEVGQISSDVGAVIKAEELARAKKLERANKNDPTIYTYRVYAFEDNQ